MKYSRIEAKNCGNGLGQRRQRQYFLSLNYGISVTIDHNFRNEIHLKAREKAKSSDMTDNTCDDLNAIKERVKNSEKLSSIL